MSPAPGRRAPGWYRDPLDRTRMRHWSGVYWDVPQRRLPPWALGTAAVVVSLQRLGRGGGPRLEGPVDVAVLPARARSSAKVRAARLGRPMPTGPSPAASGGPGPGKGLSGSAGRLTLTRRRRIKTPFTVSGAVVIAALLVVAGFVSFSKSPSTVARISSDAAYVSAANAACTSSLGAISSVAATNAATPAEVARSNKVISGLITRLQSLPTAAAVAAQTNGWFAEWSTYESDRTRQAAYVASHAKLSTPGRHEAAALERATMTAAGAADSFARSNSLGDCVLGSPAAGGTKAF